MNLPLSSMHNLDISEIDVYRKIKLRHISSSISFGTIIGI